MLIDWLVFYAVNAVYLPMNDRNIIYIVNFFERKLRLCVINNI